MASRYVATGHPRAWYQNQTTGLRSGTSRDLAVTIMMRGPRAVHGREVCSGRA